MSLLTVDQQMLAESMRALLTKKADTTAVRAAMVSKNRFDRTLWTVMCEQVGVAGIAIPDEYGGSGGGPVDALVVAEESGRVLAPTPILGSSGMCAAVLLLSDSSEAKSRLLPEIAAGSTIVSLCVANERGIWTPGDFTDGSGIHAAFDGAWTVIGQAHFVLDAACADTFLVAAMSSDGLGIFEVDARAAGVHCSGGSTMDPTRALYEVTFDGAPACRLEMSNTADVLQRAVDWGMVLLAGEQVGAAARCLELTVEYTKSRVQFGRPIGSFQALKHRMADLHVLVQSARATAYSAAASSERHVDAAVAHAYCSEAFLAVAADCVQLHGGIAITWEHDMQLYFKRAHSSSQLFGLPRRHFAAIADAAGLSSTASHQPRAGARAVESG